MVLHGGAQPVIEMSEASWAEGRRRGSPVIKIGTPFGDNAAVFGTSYCVQFSAAMPPEHTTHSQM